VPRGRSPTPEPAPTTNNTNFSTQKSKAPNAKGVKISMSIYFFVITFNYCLFVFYSDEQISCLNLPSTKHCIHITNLPMHIDAETLSDEIVWDIHDIVMNPPTRECWLKNPRDESEANEFIKDWNGRAIKGSIIKCTKKEDQRELCNKFQFGLCTKTGADCHWEHVPCTAKGNCGTTCRYGHEIGMKSEKNFSNG
jgi:hypothetical protein